MESYIKTMKIEDVKVPLQILKSHPSEVKIQNKIVRIKEGEDLHITLDADTEFLINGYTVYLAYMRLGAESINYISVDKVVDRFHQNVSTREYIYRRDNGICYICGRETLLDKENRLTTMTIDHKVPQCKGGSSDYSNLKCCCYECNNLKGNFTYSENLRKVIVGELRERGRFNQISKISKVQ